jgi:selenocysteine-specific elongation factor
MSIESIRNEAAVDDGGKLADLLIDEMVRNEVMKVEDGLVGLVGHTVDLNPDQELLAARILELYENYGLEAPEVRLLPESLSKKDDLWPMLKYLESRGDLVGLDQELFIKTSVIEMTLERVINELGGQKNLAPSDFKKIVPVSRKFLIPILNHMDKAGVTVKEGDNRMVTKGN